MFRTEKEKSKIGATCFPDLQFSPKSVAAGISSHFLKRNTSLRRRKRSELCSERNLNRLELQIIIYDFLIGILVGWRQKANVPATIFLSTEVDRAQTQAPVHKNPTKMTPTEM